MAEPAERPKKLTVDEFIAWAMTRPEGKRYELFNGEIVAMSPERAGHNRAKLAAVNALIRAIRKRGSPCETFTDGMTLRIDETTAYEPDAMVRCGEPLPPETAEITDPVILVEVLSPSTHKMDTGIKLTDYFRLPSVQHYLVVNTARRVVTHHYRDAGGGTSYRIITDGTLELDPPGLDVSVADLLEGA